jgi:hypothetical protein
LPGFCFCKELSSFQGEGTISSLPKVRIFECTRKLIAAMGLMIRLEDQDGYEVACIEETLLLNPLLPSLDDDTYELLGYVDPYGVTIFNWMQASVLSKDLLRVRAKAQSVETVALLDTIIALADKAMAEGHLYLKFSGD